MSQHIYIIELCGKRYECRCKKGVRQIRHGGVWMNVDALINQWASYDIWEPIIELAKFGEKIVIGELKPTNEKP